MARSRLTTIRPECSVRTASRSRSRICAEIVTSRPLVGSSTISRRGAWAMASARITRWHMPPGEFVWEGLQPRYRIGNADRTEQIGSPLDGLVESLRPMGAQDVGQLPPDRQDRIEVLAWIGQRQTQFL